MSYNEILQIRAAGYDISTAISIADEGYDFPEDGLYVSEDYFRNNPQTVKAFADASRKGWEWAQEHPEETLEIVMEKTHSNNIATNRTHQKWMLEEVLKDVQRADAEWNVVLLRYFNPIGAHPSALIGELPRGVPNNLVPFIPTSQSAFASYIASFQALWGIT